MKLKRMLIVWVFLTFLFAQNVFAHDVDYDLMLEPYLDVVQLLADEYGLEAFVVDGNAQEVYENLKDESLEDFELRMRGYYAELSTAKLDEGPEQFRRSSSYPVELYEAWQDPYIAEGEGIEVGVPVGNSQGVSPRGMSTITQAATVENSSTRYVKVWQRAEVRYDDNNPSERAYVRVLEGASYTSSTKMYFSTSQFFVSIRGPYYTRCDSTYIGYWREPSGLSYPTQVSFVVEYDL